MGKGDKTKPDTDTENDDNSEPKTTKSKSSGSKTAEFKTSPLDALICEQNIIAEEIEIIRSNYKSTPPTEHTKGYIKTRITAIESCWEKFRSNHQYLNFQANLSDKKGDYFTSKRFSATENVYSKFLGELYDALDSLTTPQQSQHDLTLNTAFLASSNVKLPRIDIPKFSGSYRNWRSFYDLFSTLIHDNNQLPKVQKLYFLKTSLEGEAARLIRHIDIVEKNYDAAWDLLVQRYDNKRVIVNAQLQILTSQSVIKHESPQAIKQLLDTTNECLHSLRNLDVQVDTWDEILIFLILQRLPPETRELWERSLENSKELPRLDTLTDFLESRFRTLEMVKGQGNIGPASETFKKFKKETRSFHVTNSSACPLCNKAHNLRQCSQFLQMSPSARNEFVSRTQVCLNCLAKSHPTQGCSSPKRCYHCDHRHHTLLHQSYQLANTAVTQSHHPNPSTSKGIPSNDQRITTLYVDQFQSTNFLLATALIKVVTPNGIHVLRALIDPGSQGSFITEGTARKLRLKRQRISARITGISTQPAGVSTSQVQITLNSIHNESFTCNVRAFVLKSLTGLLPTQPIQVRKEWNHIHGLALADPTYSCPGHIDILLGVDVYPSLILPGLRKGDSHSPVAQNTYLGWILFGEINSHHPSPLTSTDIVTLHSCIEVDTSLKRFWELEEVPTERLLSKEDIECEEFYRTTHHRLEGGRYEVRLPFVNLKPPLLGRSRDTAVNRLLQLERRLHRNPELHRHYDHCLQEYVRLDYMRPAVIPEQELTITTSNSENLYTVNYLPHHAVLKDSSTTPVRVVFDASNQTSNGLSLNNTLMTGPKLQEDLITIIMRWRKHRIVFTADITKMYLQIRVAKDDVPYQRILWRSSPNKNIMQYDLHTVTFGTSCAPYLAVRTLKQLAEDEKNKYPLAYSVVTNDFYVDDVMSGADDVASALEIQGQLINMLSSGGFELRKWASNCFTLVEAVPEDKREVKVHLHMEENDMIKTLGLYWNPVHDFFCFKVALESTSSTLTKRSLLSEISRLFDPVGWLTPSIIMAKILIQQLWLTGVAWDEEVPQNIANSWRELKNELYLLENLQIPRWLAISQKIKSIQLHGFCDASTVAYCAVVYLRCVDEGGITHINLIAAKSRVAPVKPVTLPRLELCSALLLAKLLHHVKISMKLDNATIYAWTDSKITLCWIHGKPNNWKTFVCNRVAAIQERLDCNCWRHVASLDNPADCGSRGSLPSSLLKHDLWWEGPRWLMADQNTWPSSKTFTQFDTTIELKSIKTHLATMSQPLEMLQKCSSLLKLLRITAFCFRFLKHCRCERANRKKSFLTAEEIRHARNYWIRTVQFLEFEKDIIDLKRGRPLHMKSRLLSLNPFICKDGILRVGGRLQGSSLSFNEKHPIILPSKHHLTRLIITQAHQATLHGGQSLMLSYLRKTYWIVNAKSTIRQVVHRCVTCFKYKAQAASQIMAQLPEPRIRISRPFTHTGVDYAGPITVRISKVRSNKTFKGYVAIFVCLCTKAIHLEAVSDQTTPAFLAALKRFIARRGLCAHIYTDCGTNFVGASKQLQRDYLQAIQDSTKEAAERLAPQGVTWHFIPPASPHFGGLWEAGVKSMKHHLRRILGETKLTFEELTTVLSQIEACLNTRPLCPLSTDPEDLSVLTPGHFLIGESMLAPPEPNLLDLKTHALSRWQLLQQLYQQFWRRWSTEYLSRLQERPKWTHQRKNIEVGNIVLIKDERSPPTQWPLGRVTTLFPGKDGLVRVVLLKTKSGTLKRPVTKLCLLPIEDNYKSNNLVNSHDIQNISNITN